MERLPGDHRRHSSEGRSSEGRWRSAGSTASFVSPFAASGWLPGSRAPEIPEGAGPLGMRWPHGIATIGDAILVSDAMVWRSLPQANDVACDFVIGQAGMAGLDHNRAAYDPAASTLNMPYGLAVQDNRLIVAATTNSRLIGFDTGTLAARIAATRIAGHAISRRRATTAGALRPATACAGRTESLSSGIRWPLPTPATTAC